jgi:cold shock CspA family protein
LIGVIEGLKPDRGFGFIDGQDGAKYFLHAYHLVGRTPFSALAVGQEVSFDAGERDGKLCAFRIEVK